MKKLNYLLAISFLFVMAACNDTLTETTSKKGAVTISANIPENPDSRVTYVDGESAVAVNWETTDVLNVYAGSISADTKTASELAVLGTDTHNCKFTFPDLNGSPTATTPLFAYVNRGANVTFDDAGAVATAKLGTQSGTLTDAASRDVLFAKGVFGTGHGIALNFAHQMAFVKVVMNISGFSPVEVTSAAKSSANATNITLSGTGLYNAVELNMADCSLKTGTAGNVVASSATVTDGVATAYMAVYPSALTGAKLTFTANGKTYEYAVGDRTLAADKMYTLNLTLVTQHITDAAWSEETIAPLATGDTFAINTEASSWLTASSSNGVLKPSATANTDAFPRGGVITVTSSTGRTKAIVDIAQYEISDFDGDEWYYGTTPCIFTVLKDTEGKPTGSMRIAGLYTDDSGVYELVTTLKDNYFSLPFQMMRTYKSTGEVDKTTYTYNGSTYYLGACGYGPHETGGGNYYVEATATDYYLSARVAITGYTVSLSFVDEIYFNYRFTALQFALFTKDYIGSSSRANIRPKKDVLPLTLTKTVTP